MPVLQVEVIPGLESNETLLGFTWNVTAETERELEIHLFFDNPWYISSNPIPDKVRLTFNDPSLFIGINGITMENTAQVVERYLPSQVPRTAAAIAVEATVAAATQTAKAVVVSNFVMNFILSASLNQLWNLINTHQVIVLMPLFKVQLPGNAQNFFNKIFQIAAFDFFETEDYINSILKLNKTEPLDANFDALGFQSMFFLNNLGSMSFVFVIYFAVILLLLVVDLFVHRSIRLANAAHWIR